MIIISHRGYWKNQNEKNTIKAFEQSLNLGIAIEVDIRDYKNNLVISHDIANETSPELTSLFDIYCQLANQPIIAFNVKSNGLQKKLKYLLESFQIKNYFIFDCSVPDALNYIKLGMPTYTRQSEYETLPAFYDLSSGVWIDEFNSNWIDAKTLEFHYKNRKKICIVSPEIHGRDSLLSWKTYKKVISDYPNINISLCTDYPLEARNFFE